MYVYHYAQFLYRLKKISQEEYATYGHWYSELLDMENFHSRLPSEQVTILFLNLCESIVSENKHTFLQRKMYAKASPEIEAYFTSYKKDLEEFIHLSSENLYSDIQNEAFTKMRNAYTAFFLNDHKYIAVQEILDNHLKLNLHRSLPKMLQFKFGPISLFNVTGVIKDMFFDLNKRPAGHFKEDDPNLPSFKKKRAFIYPESAQYWHDLSLTEREELIEHVQAELSAPRYEKALYQVKKRTLNQWFNLINLITAPILVWSIEKQEIVPQWNVFGDRQAQSYIDAHKKKEKERDKERRILKKHLQAISKISTLQRVEIYLKKNNPQFSFHEFQQRWEYEYEKRKDILIHRQKYLDSRMKEFGISESSISYARKNLLLHEMLKIETEVKPYTTYVKKAFQTALPIRKKVTFSAYRHNSDGVEFDPYTLYNHEKWIRADVMKVMESKIERGEAIQINTFCLDFSGSMDHTRMRNLFKILYLLVLGLEDRKSYDAFHFFSDYFIDVVDFTSTYTDKKVLFKIIRHITNTFQDNVLYGGKGGTNISDGISRSHEKMEEFIVDFRKTNPTANIVSSIFVITDGEPNWGITDIPRLSEFIEELRQDGDVEIKGIFIKSEDEESVELMEDIFGADHFIETSDFKEGVNKFVSIMTETYKEQRKKYKWKLKKQKLGIRE